MLKDLLIKLKIENNNKILSIKSELNLVLMRRIFCFNIKVRVHGFRDALYDWLSFLSSRKGFQAQSE